MDVALKYWQLVRIDASGKRKIQEIPAAKAFFTQKFGESTARGSITNIDIQRQLIEEYQDGKSECSQLAERCLLCFISWQIEQACWQLAAKFGKHNGFNYSDLLPYVLDDDGKFSRVYSSYKFFSLTILESFNPQQSNLENWTKIKIKKHPELVSFLLESGVYLISDWAILNDTKPQQLERIARDFHLLTELEIQEYKLILEAYHAVYRQQRLEQNLKKFTGKCQEPTSEQLKDIARYLQNLKVEKLNYKQLPVNQNSIDNIMLKLQNIAVKLRQYRIHVRRGLVITESLDYNDGIEDVFYGVDSLLDSEKEEAEFLQFYYHKFDVCLEQSLAIVIQSRVKELESKNSKKAKNFLIALRLFHCHKLTMAEIAKHLQLRAQDAVTRLLNLKDFRADVAQQMLLLLRSSIKDKAIIYSSVEQIEEFEKQITVAINEQIHKLIAEAEIQSRSPKNILTDSIFVEKLCNYLNGCN
ncbi:MAG: hypothetical protein VKN72_20040 [Nostocales cyanobacterium 94392]|nr:hypothetical protein [Nostocales cyanobacterium 94392]